MDHNRYDDECLYCSGQACLLCGAGCWAGSTVGDCEHDVSERHQYPPHWNIPHDDEAA